MKKKTLTQQIYDGLKNDIYSSEFENILITEQLIAKKYQVSKTPAREALAMLCQDGALICYPRKGYVVKNINGKEFSDYKQLRIMIEEGVIRYLIKNASDSEISSLLSVIDDSENNDLSYYEENSRFHIAMARLVGNDYLLDMLENLIKTSLRPRMQVNVQAIGNMLAPSHRQLVQAILERDEESALAAYYSDVDICLRA